MANQQCNQDQLEVRLACEQCGQEFERRELSRAEVETQAMELPDREAMSLVNANVAAPINAAIAANVLLDNSTAVAQATQTTPITQHIQPPIATVA